MLVKVERNEFLTFKWSNAGQPTVDDAVTTAKDVHLQSVTCFFLISAS